MSLYLLMLLTLVYLSLIVAVLGRRTRLGFWRSFGLSLVLTPVGALIVLFLGYEARMSRGQLKRVAAAQASAQAQAAKKATP